MSSLPFKVFTAAVAMAFACAAHAEDAKPRKHKKVAAAATASRSTQYWGTDKFPSGPLYYNGGVYLGDDPDPNIRFQLNRDISGRLGGDSN